jgi:hypothetical protein
MATFVAHGLLGGAVAALGALLAWIVPRGWKLRELSARAFWILAVYGFVVGTLPDSADWIAAVLGILPRWELYVILHHSPPTWLAVQPPFALHLWLDTFFHDPLKPGWDWWRELWWLEVSTWIVSLGILFLTWRRTQSDKAL